MVPQPEVKFYPTNIHYQNPFPAPGNRVPRVYKENNNQKNYLKTPILTPKKPLVKHEFSTIKEVTEYEEEVSDAKLVS